MTGCQLVQAVGCDLDRLTLLFSPASPATGQLDEGVAKALDFILAEAARYNIKLTPVLFNL